MGSPWPEPLRTIRETVIGELLKGKESATQFQTLLKNPSSSGDRGGSVSAEELALQISRSFTESISILSSCGVNEMSQFLASNAVGRVSSGDRSSKTSDHSRKRLGVKDRRGCYRRKNVSQSWIVVSPTTVEDGHAWRKYGQKKILNTNFPRCYFRCTHKRDQGCKATKQVQRIQEDPLMYRTTYFGHHTCREVQDILTRAPQIISDSYPMKSCLISFETKPSTKQDPFCPNYALTTPTGNGEFKDETHSDVSDNKSCLDSSTVLQDPMTNSESSGPKSSKINGAYHEEVVSGVRSCSSTPLHGPDMEVFNAKFSDLDHDPCFDELELFQDLP